MSFKMSTFGAAGILRPAHAHFDPWGLDLTDNRSKGRQGRVMDETLHASRAYGCGDGLQ
jgi:hypothetical protein